MNNYTNSAIALTTLPQFSDLKFSTMAKNYPKLHTLETLILWTIILIGMVIFWLFSEINDFPIWPLILLIIVMPLSLLVSYYSAKAMGYILREKDILYKQGLFWKKRTGVSFRRIQHIDITHGPIERKFKLATLKFFTAGGSQADLKIVGLPKKDAESIRSFILEKTGLIDE